MSIDRRWYCKVACFLFNVTFAAFRGEIEEKKTQSVKFLTQASLKGAELCIKVSFKRLYDSIPLGFC